MELFVQKSSALRLRVLRNIRALSRSHKIGLEIRRAISNGSKPPKSGQATAPLRPMPSVKPSSRNSHAHPDILLGEADKTLLYVSPNHTSFYINSYLIGGAFLFGAYSWAQFALKEAPNKDGQPTGQKIPWFIKAFLTAEVLVVAGLGTHFLLAPSNLIKSIAIVKSATSPSLASTRDPLLRLEIKRALPFLKPDVLETPSSRIFREVRVRSIEPKISGHSISLADAQKFTSEYFSGKAASVSSRRQRGVLRSLWPAIWRDTRRMFVRDQIVYLRTLDNGRFKLDLQGATVLDSARPLQLIHEDSEPRTSVLGWISRFFSSR